MIVLVADFACLVQDGASVYPLAVFAVAIATRVNVAGLTSAIWCPVCELHPVVELIVRGCECCRECRAPACHLGIAWPLAWGQVGRQ